MRTAIQIVQIISGVVGVGTCVWAFWYMSDRRDKRTAEK